MWAAKIGEPPSRPEGGEKAVDGTVAAVALVQRPLAGCDVDEHHPVLGQERGQRDHRQDLGEHLEHVDVRPAGVKFSDEPLENRSRVIKCCLADADNVAPPIGRPVHPVSKVAFSEEGVCINDDGMNLGGDLLEQGLSRQQGRPEPGAWRSRASALSNNDHRGEWR